MSAHDENLADLRHQLTHAQGERRAWLTQRAHPEQLAQQVDNWRELVTEARNELRERERRLAKLVEQQQTCCVTALAEVDQRIATLRRTIKRAEFTRKGATLEKRVAQLQAELAQAMAEYENEVSE